VVVVHEVAKQVCLVDVGLVPDGDHSRDTDVLDGRLPDHREAERSALRDDGDAAVKDTAGAEGRIQRR